MDIEILGVLLAILSSLTISVISLLIRKSTSEGSIEGTMLGILLVNTVILVPFSLVYYFPEYKINVVSLLAFLASGFLATLLFRFLYYWGINVIGASRAISIKTSTPIFATVLSVIFLNETLTIPHLLGILLIVSGIILISQGMSSEKRFTKKEGYLKAIVITLLGAFILGVEKPITKVGLNQGTPPLVGIAIKVLFALLGVIIYLLIKDISISGLFKTSATRWYVFAGIANSMGLVFIYTALSISRVVVVVPILNTAPLVTLILSYIFTPKVEKITWKIAVSALAVVLGGILITLYM